MRRVFVAGGVLVSLGACAPTPSSSAASSKPAPRAEPLPAEPEAPDAAPTGTPPDAGATSPEQPPRVMFAPRDVGPMKHGRADDGRWTPVSTHASASDPDDAGAITSASGDAGVDDSILWKTVLHPDPAHLAAELYVVAIDAARVQLHAMAGAIDPEATVPAAKKAIRPAIVPAERQPRLLAGFNGGWKSEHGHYGMKTDGVLLANPNEAACTVLAYDDDDSVRIAPWRDVASTEPRMRFFRQTPACLVVGGVRHPGLSVEGTRNWGADQDGSPIIRRSAIGTNEKRTILFVGVSNPISAPALANGMMHAGAYDLAELDVNWSFPKFLIFRPSPKSPASLDAESLFPTFVFDKGEYVRRRSPKDFFYLLRRP